jgi:membrane protein implicated in regulation of membrane protease activity
VQRLAGGALTLAGAFIVAALFVLAFSDAPAVVAMALVVDPAYAAGVSALGQIVFLIGVWMLWSARPARPRIDMEVRNVRHGHDRGGRAA